MLYNIPVVGIVFADGAFGNVKRMQQELHGGRVLATDLKNPDFVAMAESFGAMGLRATSPDELKGAIRSCECADVWARQLAESSRHQRCQHQNLATDPHHSGFWLFCEFDHVEWPRTSPFKFYVCSYLYQPIRPLKQTH